MVEKVFGTPSFAFFITKLPKASSTVLNESNADFSSLEALLFTMELHPAQGGNGQTPFVSSDGVTDSRHLRL